MIPQQDAFWDGLATLVPFLTPFQIATDIVQSDSATLFDVYHQFASLATQIDTIDAAHAYHSVKEAARKAIIHHWNKNINKSPVIVCAQLSFDNTHTELFTRKDINEAFQWFLKSGSQYLKYYGMSDSDDIDSIEVTLLQRWGDFTARRDTFSEVIAYKEKLRTKQLTANLVVNTGNGKQYSRWDARSVWNLYLPTATELAACALALLSITASEAAVERSFSMQDVVHSDRRNRLLNSSVQDEMFIKFNHRALGKTDDTGGCVFELNEEYEAEYTTTAFNSDITPQAEADPNLADAAVALILHSDSEEKQDNNNACEPETMPVDTVAAFITQYIRDHHITASYKWNSDKLNALEGAAIASSIADTSAVLREKIRSQVIVPRRSAV